MRFKEWLQNEINKGLARNFRQNNPHMPRYVQHQVLQNRLNPLVRNSGILTAKNTTHPTIDADTSDNANTMSLKQAKSDSDFEMMDDEQETITSMLNNPRVSNLTRDMKWKKEIVTLHPASFNEKSLRSFLVHKFGGSEVLSKRVRNHDERMKIQDKLSKERKDGDNEPIIMVKDGDKYQMEEGWHRLFSYFLNHSATPEDVEHIRNDNIRAIDMKKWKPFKIKAYVGYP